MLAFLGWQDLNPSVPCETPACCGGGINGGIIFGLIDFVVNLISVFFSAYMPFEVFDPMSSTFDSREK
jgi:hypothetical protein